MIRYTRHIGFLLLCCAVALAGASCGYRFTGEGDFPYGVKKVAVDVLKNRSAEAGLESTLANDIIYEMTRGGKVTVTDEENADAVIRGTIQMVDDRSISRSDVLTAESRRVFIRVDLRFSRTKGETLWKTEGMEEDEAYAVSEDPLVTESNRRRALDRLSRRLAEKVYSRITASF